MAKKSGQVDKPISLESVSPSEARVMIAKDVISSLRSKHICAIEGGFVNIPHQYPPLYRGEAMHKRLAEMNCGCCALGAIFVSAVERFNGVRVGVNMDSCRVFGFDDIKRPLRRFFSAEQMKLIEIAFEVGGGYFLHKKFKPAELGLAARNFGFRYDDPEQRMVAIMRNIIRNDGEFKPPLLKKQRIRLNA